MDTCTIVIKDEVNVKLEGLDPFVRRKITEALKFFIPYARHTPAFKLGRWDGMKSFCTVGGQTYLNLLDRVLPIIMDHGYEIDIQDHRQHRTFIFPHVDEEMFSDRTWPVGHPLQGQPIVLREHQANAIQTFVDNPQAIQNISTGSGKTLLSAALSAICEPHGRTLIIVPNRSLVEQTEDDYKNLGLDVGVIFGGRHEYGHTHTIATWQSLDVVNKKTKKGEAPVDFDELVRDVVCVMVDEVHTAKGNVLLDLLTGPMANIPIRWGFTGTVPKEDHEFLCILSSLGPVVGEVKAIDLQEKGILASCHVNVVQMVDDHVEYDNYHDEHNYLVTDETRLRWIADFVEGLEGNTLVLIDRIETGKVLEDMIQDSAFVSGSTATSKRRAEYKSVVEGGNTKLIATSGVAAVGINIVHINNVVFISYGKSFQKTIQSIGRGLRTATNKKEVAIYDVCSTMKFDKRHLSKRIGYYKEAEYPHSKVKVEYRKPR